MSHPPVYGTSELAERFDVTRVTIERWRRGGTPHFPAPWTLRCGPVWDYAEIEAWARDRVKGRALTALRALRAGATQEDVAVALDVGPRQIHRWVNGLAGATSWATVDVGRPHNGAHHL